MIKRNQYFKNAHHTKKTDKNITDAPDSDAKIDADDDAADSPNTADNDAGSTDSKESTYSPRNHNHAPNSSDDDATYPDDPASPNSLIDSKLKCKIDPMSMIKIIFLIDSN